MSKTKDLDLSSIEKDAAEEAARAALKESTPDPAVPQGKIAEGLAYYATCDFREQINHTLLAFKSGDLITDPYVIQHLLDTKAPIAPRDGVTYVICPCPCRHRFAYAAR